MPAWRQRQLKLVENKQDLVVSSAVSRMNKILKKAVDQIWENYERGGNFIQPNLNDMFDASEEFYKNVLAIAIQCSKSTKSMQRSTTKHLARLPYGLPRNLKGLEQLFRDKRYWPKVMKRSKLLTERLRKSYLLKLKKRFDKVIPKVLSNEMTPNEAKAEMLDGWRATKDRVETIYRTETTNYFARTQVAFFENDEDIIGYLFDSIRDSGTTEICRKRHGLVYRPGTKELRENMPALHYKCRSHLIPLANTPENRKLLNDPSRDPRNRSVPPLPKGWRN